jgi:hypothetical protein
MKFGLITDETMIEYAELHPVVGLHKIGKDKWEGNPAPFWPKNKENHKCNQ